MWDLADWKDTVTYEDCDGSLLWQTADCQCRISAQKSFLGVSQSLSQRKGVNSYRKCFGDSFSEKTGVVWPFVSPSLWPCGSILTEHCIIFLALFSWMLKPCGVLLFPNVLPDWKGEDAAEMNRGESVYWNWELKQQLLGHLSPPAADGWPCRAAVAHSPAKPSLPGLLHFVLKTCLVLIRLQNNWWGF